jgi:Sugar-transfer associated ATP-grasp
MNGVARVRWSFTLAALQDATVSGVRQLRSSGAMHWLNRARRLRRIAGDYYYVLKNEKRVSSNPPALWKRLSTLRHGFFSEKTRYYDFGKYNPSLFISDAQRNPTRRKINGEYNLLMGNKIVFERILPNGIMTPKNYAFLDSGRLRTLSDDWQEINLDDLIRERNGREKLVLKPVQGSCGRGVFIIGSRDDSIEVNNETIGFSEVRARFAELRDYVVTEYVKQGDFPSSIFPGAVNTIRILTMSDPDTDEPFIAAAAHRFGNVTSAPVDNLHLGGISALIDLQTGALSPAAERTRDGVVMHDTHPDTGSQISGRVVPDWSSLKQHVLKVANLLPFLCYVGWDIALSAKGPVFIEGNSNPNPRPFQLHRPLLLDSRVRRFYEKHGII